MTAIPPLSDLIREVLLDGLDGPRDPIRHIGKAERLAGELTHLGDSLVGFFVEQARAEGLSWAEIGAPRGLSRQGAQQRYAPLLSHLTVADLVEAGALRQLGDAALAALRRAAGHALRLDRDEIDTGDLLLGVLDIDGSPAVAAIRELGIDLADLRSELGRSGLGRSELGRSGLGRSELGRSELERPQPERPGEDAPGRTWHRAPAGVGPAAGEEGAGESGDRTTSDDVNTLPLSAETRRAIDGAVAEARGHLVSPGHLLLGILRNPGSRAGRVLGARGVTKPAAMGAILAVGSRQSADQG